MAKALTQIKKNGVDLETIIKQSQSLYKQATEGYYVEKASTQGVVECKEFNLPVAVSILKLQAEQLRWIYDRLDGYSEEGDPTKLSITLNQAIPIVRSLK